MLHHRSSFFRNIQGKNVSDEIIKVLGIQMQRNGNENDNS